VCLRLRCL